MTAEEVSAAAADGSTALHYAAYNGHASCAELLVRHGAALDRKDMEGERPLALARRGHPGNAALLAALRGVAAPLRSYNPPVSHGGGGLYYWGHR